MVYDSASVSHGRSTPIPTPASNLPVASRSVVMPPDWIDAYRKYFGFWMSLARSSSLRTEDAKDIVHGVIESALAQGRGRFESLEHIRNYVARGVLNRAILFHQRGGRTTEFSE